MSVHRLPDGSTVFLCGRQNGKNSTTPEEVLARELGQKAVEQGRCPLCLSPVEDRCGQADGGCQRPLASLAKAYAILNGMQLG